MTSRFNTVLSLAGITLVAAPASSQQLTLVPTDSSGRTVEAASVEVLLVAWGGTLRVPIPRTATGYTVTLTDRWLHQQWPERARDVTAAFLYVRADGHASARSAAFTFLPDSLAAPDPVRVSFTRGSARVERQRSATLRLRLDPVSVRRIMLEQADGRPAAGVPVAAYMYWSSANHCGVLAGADSLAAARTDANGTISVPAGDIEYAFVLGDTRWMFEAQREQALFRGRLIRRITEPETRLRVVRMAEVDVELRITRAGAAVPGLVLRAWVADCPCGACDGPLGTSDASGRIVIRGFMPEEWERTELVDEAGVVRWRGRPLDWRRGGVIEIEITG